PAADEAEAGVRRRSRCRAWCCRRPWWPGRRSPAALNSYGIWKFDNAGLAPALFFSAAIARVFRSQIRFQLLPTSALMHFALWRATNAGLIARAFSVMAQPAALPSSGISRFRRIAPV